MTKVLVINSSASGEASVSSGLTATFAAALAAADPLAEVAVRDVGTDPLPPLTPARLPGIRAVADSPVAEEAAALSDLLIAELQAADVLVIGSPMYNFGISAALKGWFDHVLRPRVTFRYSEAGPEGLVTGKRAIVVESRSGFYSEGPGKAVDHQEPHTASMLAFIGITDVTFVRAEKLAMSPEDRTASIEGAASQLRELAQPVGALSSEEVAA